MYPTYPTEVHVEPSKLSGFFHAGRYYAHEVPLAHERSAPVFV